MARSRSRDDDDDDDDYDDRPRKKKRRRDDDDDRGSGGGNGTIIAVSVVGGVLVIVGIVVAIVLGTSKTKKEDDAPPVVNNGANPFPGVGPNPFVPPNNQPPPKPKSVEPPKAGPGAVVVQAGNFGLQQIAFAGGPNGFAAIGSINPNGLGHLVDIVQTPTGKAAGQVTIEEIADDGFALAPDAKHFASIAPTPFEGDSVSLYSVADNKLLKRFRPYPKKNDITTPNLIWVGFTAPNRIMTVNEGGGFDLWSVPAFERVAGATNKIKPGLRVSVNGFTHSPDNFALSADGQTIAMFNGAGFTFYNATTAAEIGRTEDLVTGTNSAVFSGAAFSPDGATFACYFQVFGQGGTTNLKLWNAKTGADAGGGVVGKTVSAPAGFAWWGSKHLVFWEGGIGSGRVFDIAKREMAGKVRAVGSGKFGTVPPNGELWAVTGTGRFGPDEKSMFLVRAAPPAAISTGSEWEIGGQGLVLKVSAP